MEKAAAGRPRKARSTTWQKFVRVTAWASISLALATGCTDRGCKNERPAGFSQVPVSILRLDSLMAGLADTAQAKAFVAGQPLFAHQYLFAGLPGGGAPTRQDSLAVITLLLAQAQDKYLDTMRQDVDTQIPSLALQAEQLSELFGTVHAYWPDFAPPRQVGAVVSGFSVDLLLLDSLLLIGLESFLDERSHYDAPELPAYIRHRMRPAAIVPGVARLISNRYNKAGFSPEPLMVDEMIRWGKAHYFVEKTMPCLPDTAIIGYSAATLAEAESQAEMIYGHFVSSNLFFSKDQLLRSKYCGERPSIPEIGNRCPGRIGQWLGWQIVRKYAKDKNLSLPQVMAQTDAKMIFDQARWRP